MAIKYKDFEKREQLRKDYIDKAAEAAKTQANAYTDEQIRNIPAPPAPDIPTALPQTYKKKAVTLATNGWAASDVTILATATADFPINTSKFIGTTPYYSSINASTLMYITETYYGYVNKALHCVGNFGEGFAFGDETGSNYKITINVYTRGENQGKIYGVYRYVETKSTVTVSGKIPGETFAYDYALTDADIKVNSEVRFTLDEANGKLAGQLGLKKTIDKEAGKLTFTADTLPTSAISGTLEIGETSTEGAAFVEGISSEGVKANEENTFTAKQTFQDVQINGNLTAKGTTTTVDVKNLDVEQQLITVAKGNTAALTSPAGLKAEKYDGTKDGALVFDASGTAMVGDVVLDANGNIDAAQSDLQDLATRAKPSELTDGHLLKWDATNKKIVDGGEISSGGGNEIEQTAAVIKFPTFLINGTKVQRVYITGRETIQPGGSKQATVNLATYGIDAAKIMMTDGKMHEYILASATTLSTDTTYFPKVRTDTADVSGNLTLFMNIDTEPPAEEACIINYQYICLIKVEV